MQRKRSSREEDDHTEECLREGKVSIMPSARLSEDSCVSRETKQEVSLLLLEQVEMLRQKQNNPEASQPDS